MPGYKHLSAFTRFLTNALYNFRYSAGRPSTGAGLSGIRLLAVTLRQLRHKYQLLLLPVIGFIGAEQAFMAADFTQVKHRNVFIFNKICYVG